MMAVALARAAQHVSEGRVQPTFMKILAWASSAREARMPGECVTLESARTSILLMFAGGAKLCQTGQCRRSTPVQQGDGNRGVDPRSEDVDHGALELADGWLPDGV